MPFLAQARVDQRRLRARERDSQGRPTSSQRAAPTRRSYLSPAWRGAGAALSRLGRIYQGEVTRLLERYPNARAQGQLHSRDYMIVKDLARTYPTSTAVSYSGR